MAAAEDREIAAEPGGGLDASSHVPIWYALENWWRRLGARTRAQADGLPHQLPGDSEGARQEVPQEPCACELSRGQGS